MASSSSMIKREPLGEFEPASRRAGRRGEESSVRVQQAARLQPSDSRWRDNAWPSGDKAEVRR
jgi:hypothetical protein